MLWTAERNRSEWKVSWKQLKKACEKVWIINILFQLFWCETMYPVPYSWIFVALHTSPGFWHNYHKHRSLTLAGVWLQTPVMVTTVTCCLSVKMATVLMHWHAMNSVHGATDSRSGLRDLAGMDGWRHKSGWSWICLTPPEVCREVPWRLPILKSRTDENTNIHVRRLRETGTHHDSSFCSSFSCMRCRHAY